MKKVFDETNALITEGILKQGQLSEVSYRDGDLTIFGLDDGVEIILGKEDHRKRLKRASQSSRTQTGGALS